VAIGAHTRTHRGLAYASPEDQRAEIATSRDDLERWLGRPPTSFAYPFGVPGADLDAVTMRIVRETGFSCAVVNAPGAVGPKSDRFALPRAAVPDLDGDAFARWLDALAR
jgi:peptidoglycan/xylan/chitin deacetylase (PgdA/CDA1 family)